MPSIGIPRSLFYYNYFPFVNEFFKNLNCDVIVSSETNKKTLISGIKLAVDESCLSIKIFLGHVNELISKVDYLLIPRMESVYKREELCARFLAFPDLIRNTFGDVQIIEPNIVNNKLFSQFITSTDAITRNYIKKFIAYNKAMVKQKAFEASISSGSSYIELYNLINNNNNSRKATKLNTLNVALLGHIYNIYDKFLGYNVATKLEKLGVNIKTLEMLPSKDTREAASFITRSMPWTYNKEIIGATKIYIDENIDGIIYLTTFPCGPDAMSTEIAIRKFKNQVPIVNLILDELEGEAGLDTRLEILVDMIKIKQERGIK